MKTLDCRGLACPKPVIMTKKEIEAMQGGELEIVVDNTAAKENVTKFVKNLGLEYDSRENGNIFYITVKKSGESNIENSVVIDSNITEDTKNLVILITNDKMGLGDDKLGSALMKSYMFAMTESDAKPKAMLFLNAGVKLTVEDSDVIESLKNLEVAGVEILSCGTCLDFYNLKEKLSVGSVTNMYTIVEKMNSASNTIKL
jgi:selenium metabolism protein YedF